MYAAEKVTLEIGVLTHQADGRVFGRSCSRCEFSQVESDQPGEEPVNKSPPEICERRSRFNRFHDDHMETRQVT